jgi:hypothetical protein
MKRKLTHFDNNLENKFKLFFGKGREKWFQKGEVTLDLKKNWGEKGFKIHWT